MKIFLGRSPSSQDLVVSSDLIAGGIYGVFASMLGFAAYSFIGEEGLSLKRRITKGAIGAGVTVITLPLLLYMEYQLSSSRRRFICHI